MLKAHICVTATLVTAALLIAATVTAHAARANRSPTSGSTSTTTTQQGHPSPNYGPGWCYRHPYTCSRTGGSTR